jgi:hypothetical protein
MAWSGLVLPGCCMESERCLFPVKETEDSSHHHAGRGRRHQHQPPHQYDALSLWPYHRLPPGSVVPLSFLPSLSLYRFLPPFLSRLLQGSRARERKDENDPAELFLICDLSESSHFHGRSIGHLVVFYLSLPINMCRLYSSILSLSLHSL